MAVNWKRNAGKIMCAGDSITVGFMAENGGWRKKLFTDLVAAGIICQAVGNFTNGSTGMVDNTNHRGNSGDQAKISKSTIGADVTSYKPNVIIYGWGVNDIGTALSSAATYLDDLDACIDACQAVGFATHIVQTMVQPTSGHTYYAQIAVFITAAADLPARVAAQGASLCDIGAPETSDGLHPSDGATGYDAMATAIYNSVLAVIP